ncbi:MAG: PTS glucose transporter subunit IIA [Lachnospiraceae bacterium]|nr:PTS glucose transporter subunit IIA [Lachnospiraceae bacterium]
MLNLFRGLKKDTAKHADYSDAAIIAMADGDMFSIEQVNDPVFSAKMLGDGVAFRYDGDKVVLCSPANGVLSILFPTGHAYGIEMKDGTELLVHVGLDTVNAKGDGFKLLGRQQGEEIKAGDPVVAVDLKKLSLKYDMSTMLIVTNANKNIQFIEPCKVVLGQELTIG